MPLTTEKTQIEIDVASKDSGVMRVAEAYHYAAMVQAHENDLFWSLPTDRLLALLNHDVALTLTTFAANTAIAAPNNAMLEAVNSTTLPNRAPTEMGRDDIAFNGTSFILNESNQDD